MIKGSKNLTILVLVVLSLVCVITFFLKFQRISFLYDSLTLKKSVLSVQTASPSAILVNGRMMVKYPEDYTLLLLGDSMTELMGNSDELRSYLNRYYPTKTFEVLNYGYGSTNVLTVQKRLEEETVHGRVFRPILDIDFDLILIESFGHNPLSDYPLETGLQKQNEALDKMVSSIRSTNPDAQIVFVATIAPNKKMYASKVVDLSPESREIWFKERVAYIKNHVDYAKSHNIPLVNVYEKSLSGNDGGNLEYINSADYIHPSPTGIYLISREIANVIYQNHLLKE